MDVWVFGWNWWEYYQQWEFCLKKFWWHISDIGKKNILFMILNSDNRNDMKEKFVYSNILIICG